MNPGKWKPQYRNLDWLGSVWHVSPVLPYLLNWDPERNRLKEPHPAVFPDDLPARCILLYTQKGDTVLDPFVGSGTTAAVACALFRKAIGYDVEEKYLALARRQCGGNARLYCKSSERMEEVEAGSVRLCVTSPPYLDFKRYSDSPANIGNHGDPYPALERVFAEVFRTLAPGGHFCLNVADLPAGRTGCQTTFPFDLLYMCLRLGFGLRSTIVWDKGLRLKDYHIETGNISQCHEYVWVLRKPEGPGSGQAYKPARPIKEQ